jgi:hypothetical protein
VSECVCVCENVTYVHAHSYMLQHTLVTPHAPSCLSSLPFLLFSADMLAVGSVEHLDTKVKKKLCVCSCARAAVNGSFKERETIFKRTPGLP